MSFVLIDFPNRGAKVKMLKLMLLFTIFGLSSPAKLNVPKLLLPYYSSVATNFTLEVSDGCFTWRSTRPEIVIVNRVEAQDGAGCSQRAVVTATSRVPTRKTAIVIAEDPISGQQLRCDVIVDEISSIAIETTTHELYLDDSPEEFVIRAMNEEADVFSTLDGISFEWNLLPDSIKGQNLAPANNILRFISFFESAYKAMPYIKTLETQGKRGDRILVRGIRTGSAKVSVKPDDVAYKHVVEPVVRIIVMANIQLTPPIVYLMQHTTVVYTVELIKQNKVHHIAMPSQQYYLEVANKEIASLNEGTSTATALFMGDTEVLLKDRHINLAGMFREPSAGIYVVNPGYLEFQVFPDPNWVLQTNRIYQVTIDVYDKESHKIYPSNNIRIEAMFPKEYFEVQLSSENGTYHVVKTLQKGFTDIDGILAAVILEDGSRHEFSPVIQNSQEVEIYDPIQVLPPVVVLPWIPIKTKNYVFQLAASGGSGNYTWSSGQPEVATVTTKGQVVSATVTGQTEVKATDSKNMAHFDTMQTFVLPPGEMEFLPCRVEAEIGTFLDLPLAVFGKIKGKRHRFDECHLMPLETVINDQGVFSHVQETKPTVEGSCASVKVKALSQGHTQVKVVYQYKEVTLKAVVTIAAYKPLKPVDPEEITVVTPAASRDMVFEGGPQPWVLDPSKYSQILGGVRLELIRIQPVRKIEGQKSHIFRVLCLQLGEQTLSLRVGNGPTAKNQFPAEATATVKFACEEPKGIRLIPLVTLPTGLPPCPVNPLYDDPVPVHSYKGLNMQVTVRDRLGRHFDNFSSLALDWHLSDLRLAEFVVRADGRHLLTEVVRGEKAAIRAYRPMTMKGEVGTLDVKAEITGYRPKYFTDVPQHTLETYEPISDMRTLHLVADSRIEPNTVTIYNHITNKASLQILEGSGHFHLDYSNSNHAKIEFDEKKSSRDLSLLPVSEGQFTVTAWDLCVEGLAAAKANVFVSDVHRIVLRVVDKVEIHKEIEAEVEVYDRLDQPIQAQYFSHMTLKPKTETDLISIRPVPGKLSPDSITVRYIVRGVILGRTTLQFSANQMTGRVVNSQPQEIQVFPPLRLEPRNITLIIGAQFQVTAHGGPQPQSTIEFSMKDGKIASVSSTGLLEALKLGSSNIVGKAVGTDGANGRIVYSQDEVTVNVVLLEGIRIFAPLKRLQTDTQMPLYAVGLHENETPFTFGSAIPPLSFDWSISNKDVAALNPLFHKSGLTPAPENNFAVRLFAEEAGHVTVRLTVRGKSDRQIRGDRKLTDDVQIQVYERLRLTSPSVCDGKLLMTPDTETNINTNRDGSTARLSYTVHSESKSSAITIDESGHLISGSSSGQASVVITSHEEFGVNQSLVILVQVKPISYVMINADTVINTYGSELSEVPIGTSLHFSISFHDTVGEKFFATNSKIRYSSNRYDILQIGHGNKNDTLQAKATNLGHTVLKVWDRDNPRLADYVNIAVGDAISPRQLTVNLGDVICFSSPLITNDGHRGFWLSDNHVIQVEMDNGFGVATHVGTSHLTYNVSSYMATYTDVDVLPITSVKLQADSVTYMSNHFSKYKSDTVLVPVDFGNEAGEMGSSIRGTNCSEILQEAHFELSRFVMRCEVSLASHHSHVLVEDLVKISTQFDVHTGKYHCALTQTPTPAELSPVISSLTTSLNLWATVTARDNQPEVASKPVSVPYVPGFHVQPGSVQLSNEMPMARLRVSATEKVAQDLKVQAVDSSLITISAPEIDMHGNRAVNYPITLQLTSALWDRHELETAIEISSPLLGQTEIIPVKVKLIGTKEDQPKTVFGSWSELLTAISNNYQSITFNLFCIIFTVACIIIAYHVIVGQRYQQSQQAGVFMNQSQSPQHSGTMSPWGSGQRQHPDHSFNQTGASPPTPRARLWSVDYGPYDGNSLFKKSPLRQSPQHS